MLLHRSDVTICQVYRLSNIRLLPFIEKQTDTTRFRPNHEFDLIVGILGAFYKFAQVMEANDFDG